jgi:hypothetical protein
VVVNAFSRRLLLPPTSTPVMQLARHSPEKQKPKKAKPEIINKLNSISMTLPAFDLAESEKFTM